MSWNNEILRPPLHPVSIVIRSRVFSSLTSFLVITASAVFDTIENISIT